MDLRVYRALEDLIKKVFDASIDPSDYIKRSERGAANGVASLDGSTLVPTAELGSGVADGTTFLRGDGTWVVAGITDHGGLTGLSDDDHPVYAHLAGRAGGQVLVGGIAGGEGLLLRATLDPTPGNVTIESEPGVVVAQFASTGVFTVGTLMTVTPSTNIVNVSASSAGGTVNFQVQNTNTAADSNARLLLASADLANGADVFVHFITSGTAFSMGTDGSADIFKLTTGATPSAGTELLTITTSGVLTAGGSITATSGSLRADGASGTAVAFIDIDDGATVGAGAAGEVRLRSNAGVFEVSESGAAFTAVLGAGVTGTGADNQVVVWTGASTVDGSTGFVFGVAGLIINEDGTAGFDMRWESDNSVNGLFCDAGNDRIVMQKDNGSLPTLSGDTALVIANTSVVGDNVEMSFITGTSGAIRINFGNTADENVTVIRYRNDLEALNFNVSNINILDFDPDAAGVVFNEGGADLDWRAEGDTLSHMLALQADSTLENIVFLGAAAPDFQTMDRGIFIGDVATAPTGNPSVGGFMYSNAGAGTWRGSSGQVTAFGPAGPHCSGCGHDNWRLAQINTKYKSWIFDCARCGMLSKGGPDNILDDLTEHQKAEIVGPSSTFADVCKAMGIAS